MELDNVYLRENSVKDIGTLLDWIATQPYLDKNNVVVDGGNELSLKICLKNVFLASYGGYMVLASMIHFKDRLRAGIERVGISNFVSFLENTGEYR